MATSGVNTFSATSQQMIRDAFAEATIYRIGQTIPAEQYNFAKRKLNELIKGWQVKGNNIWKDKRATLFLQYNQASYTLGGSSTDHATESFVSTTLSAAASSGDGNITVTSATGMTIGDYIGIIKDSGYIFWTTISNIVSTTVSLTDNLDGDCASGKTVYAYTTKITKPLVLSEINIVQSDNNEVILYHMPREDYFNLSDKTSQGTPSQYYYERRRIDGKIYLWTVPTDMAQYVQFTYQPYLDDVVNTGDELDFPIEWQRALILNLAAELCLPFGVGIDTHNRISANANYWYNVASGNDNQDGYLILTTETKW